MATKTTTIKFVGQFDSSGITKGLQEIKKQMSNTHIGEDLQKQLETALNKVEVNIPALEKMSAKGEYNTKELEEFQKVIQQVSKDMQSLDKLAGEADFTKVFSKADNDKVKQFEKQLNDVENKIKSFKKEIIESTEQKEKTKIEGGAESIVNQLLSVKPDEIKNKFDEIIKETTIQSDKAKQELEKALSDRSKSFKQNSDVIDFLFGQDSGITIKHGKGGAAVDAIQQAKEAIQSLAKGEEVENASQKLERLYQLVSGTGEFEGAFNNPNGIKSQFEGIISAIQSGDFDKVKDLLPTLQEFSKNKFSLIQDGEAEKLKITEEYAAFLNERLKSLAESGKLTKEQIALVSKELGIFNDKAKEGIENAKQQKTQQDALNATFGSLANRIENAVSAMAVFNKSMQIVRQAINSVKELDAAFTQIAIVSEQSSEEAWKMFDSFNSLAKQYSITTKDLAEGAKLFYQQGLNAADTMKMVEASTVSAALGEVSMTEAANTLTAAIQGYNESAAVAMDYTDKIAMVGAVSAADFNELSAAMEKTASSAYTAGIDFDHLLGYLGKMIEVTREAPANLGTAMKTIIARFEDMKKDPEAIIDGASANKVEEALATIGIALRDTAGEFRPLQDVFDELGMKWETLTRNQQAYIATVAAGSRQQSRFLAMMNNYDRTLDLIIESQNSAGAAAKQYATYQDSIAAAQARLTASWEKFYSKIVDNDIIKFAINSLSKLVDALSHVPPAITAIGASLGALGLQNLLQKNGGLPQIIGKLLGNKADKSIIEGIGEKFAEDFIGKFKNKSISEISDMTDIWGALKKSAEQSSGSLDKFGTSLKNVGSGFVTVGRTIIGFIAGNWQLIAVAALVGGAIYLITKALTKQKREYEETIKNIKKYNEESEKLNTEADNAENLLNSYDKLVSKTNRTKEEQEELNSTISQIEKIYPNAITWVDEYGNSHLENSKILREEIELERDLAKQKQRAALEKEGELLSGDRKNWKKEDFTDAGISNPQLDKYFENEEKLKYYKNYYNPKNGLPGIYNLNSPFMTGLLNLDSLQFAIDENEITEIEAASLAIKDINKYIEYFKLNINKLDEDASWESVIKKVTEITNFKDNLPQLISNLEQGQDELVDHLQRNNKMKRSILDLVYDPKAGTASAQRAVTAKLQTFISGLSNEAYKELEKKFPEGKLSNFMQEIIDNVTIDNADEVAEMFETLLDPNASAEELESVYKQLGNLCGNDFNEGFKEAMEKQAEVAKQAAIDWFNTVFPDNNVNIEDKTTEELNKYSKLGDKYGIHDINEMDELFPFLEKIEEKTNDFIKKGTVDGLEEAIDEVTSGEEFDALGDDLKEKLEKIAEESISNTTKDVLTKIMSEAMDAANTKLKESKDNFSTASSIFKKENQESLNDKEYEFLQQQMENADSFIRINDEGEKYLSILGKIVLLEKEREDYAESIIEKIKMNEDYITALNESQDGLTEAQQKQIDNYKQQNRLLNEQLDKLKDIENATITAKAMSENISYADTYYNSVDAIKKAEEEAVKSNGRIKRSTAEALKSMNIEYAKYLNIRETSEGAYYELTTDNAEKMKKIAYDKYETDLELEKDELNKKINVLQNELDYFQLIADGEKTVDIETYNSRIENLNNLLVDNKAAQDERISKEEEADKQIVTTGATAAQKWAYNWIIASQKVSAAAESAHKSIEDGSTYNGPTEITLEGEISTGKQTSKNKKILSKAKQKVKSISNKDEQSTIKNDAQKQVSRIQAAIDALTSARDQLVPLAPDLDDVTKSTGSAKDKTDELEKATEALNDALEEMADALEDLNNLLKEFNRNLNDINVDYSPFLDRLEEWEHEWDYFYNIKRLISELDTKGTFIDNIISAGYTSADEKDQARKAKMGNILAKMSANDAYITALRAGMAKTGVEVMEQYGDYYKINPETGQIYQTDKNLNDINKTINEKREEIYNLQKQQNEKQNDLNLENAKLEALEEEKSAYEDILSTIDSQIDSLEDNEDITADLTELLGQKTEIQTKIDVTQGSIDDTKEKIKNMEDEIQNIEVQITLGEQDEQDLEDYVNKMEEKVDEYQQYWENINGTIAEQQELLQQLYEMKQYYVDTAIQTEQELYNAVVENYQNEINEKKKQYDYLKKLDQDYLNSIKNNISKERQLREDANKQRSYQQSLQRARLLQMDTSGAYRNDLADLNKQIESQRQDLYDDLIDKQYDALEKEINKRHELYDKETTALDERLKYMQENAILLWEQVNGIVNQGTNAMMATLENTNNYINSNELSRMEQRSQWENNVKTTYEGIEGGYIGSVSTLIDAGKNFVDNVYPEISAAVTTMASNFDDAIYSITTAANDLSSGIGDATSTFSGIIDKFMQDWNLATNDFTGYSESWSTMVQQLKESTSNNLSKISGYYDEEGKAREGLLGSINKYAESLSTQSSQIYNDFIDERQKYRNELDGVIKQIQQEISASIVSAGAAIQNAANSIQFSAPQQPATDTSGSGGPTGPGGTEPTGPGGGGEPEKPKRYKIKVHVSGQDADGEKIGTSRTLDGFSTEDEAINAAKEFIKKFAEEEKLISYGWDPLIPVQYAKGGLASFTGPAWLDGTKSNPERVLSPKQTKLFESMVSSLERVSLNNSNINSALGSSYNIGDINTSINVEKLDNETDIEKVARQVENRIMKSIRNRVSIAIA